MEKEIKIFENEEFGSVRTLKEEAGRVVFCGKDVAAALGYSNTKDAIKRHCRWGVKHDLPHPQSPSKTIEMTFIPESDVYRLVAHSRLPSAEKFESWVFDEVLPSIRQTGGYGQNIDLEKIISQTAAAVAEIMKHMGQAYFNVPSAQKVKVRKKPVRAAERAENAKKIDKVRVNFDGIKISGKYHTFGKPEEIWKYIGSKVYVSDDMVFDENGRFLGNVNLPVHRD